MKIFIVCSTLDLQYKMGCTPHWWQLFKALYEVGNELIIIPFLGDSIETLWWRTYPNPCLHESKLYNRHLDKKKKQGKLNDFNTKSDNFSSKLLNKYIKNKWKKHVSEIFESEKNIDGLLLMNVPLSYISDVARFIKNEYAIPIIYFDGDMPIALPEFVEESNYKIHNYKENDLCDFDMVFTNSKGVLNELQDLGAKRTHPIYYAADPDIYSPLLLEKDIDVSFFGFGSAYREEWIHSMISRPSEQLHDKRFVIAGKGFDNIGKAEIMGNLSFSAFRDFCCRSNICLNITRKTHASVYASASARPFELAAYGACMISNPVNGIEEWFDVDKEITIVKNEDEAVEMYDYFLSNPDKCSEMGERARKRVLKDHTFCNRATEITNIFKDLSKK